MQLNKGNATQNFLAACLCLGWHSLHFGLCSLGSGALSALKQDLAYSVKHQHLGLLEVKVCPGAVAAGVGAYIYTEKNLL